MWPILFRALRTYAPYVTLPFAAMIGFIGYNLENKFSDKYTPFTSSIKDSRSERLISEEALQSASKEKKIGYDSGVLTRNISPSLAK